MGYVQGIQGHQEIKAPGNNMYDSTDSNSSSSYVSSSGVKSILSNAWNAIKSAFSNVLSAFGNHLGGQQGSDKPGREIVMDTSSHPLPQIPSDDDGSDYASVCDYAEAGNIGAPAGSSELKDESTGESVYATVKKSTVAQKDTNYWKVWGVENSTMAGNVEHGETVDMSSPAPGYNTGGTPLYTQTPENDPRGENDYADPKGLLFNQEQFLQRMMSERLKTL